VEWAAETFLIMLGERDHLGRRPQLSRSSAIIGTGTPYELRQIRTFTP